MRFTAQLQHLSASVASSQKAAHYALKYRDMDEDLHSCILEQLERVRTLAPSVTKELNLTSPQNNMNNSANMMYFIEQFCELAMKENHLPYVRMMQRDMLRVVDAVAPADGSGAANVKHIRRVLNGLQTKEILSAETVAEIDAGLKERETHLDGQTGDGHDDAGKPKTGTPRGAKANGMRPDKRQIETRIEEDRERNKRLRESMWTVSGDDDEEERRFWEETSDIGEDDFVSAYEESMERRQMVPASS